jgi:hypothetical protein
MDALIAWLRANAILAVALTALATLISGILAAVVTVTTTLLKWYLDKNLGRKQSLRQHQLAQLSQFGTLIDSIVSWNLEYLGTVTTFEGPKLTERMKVLFARQPLFAFHPSVLMTLSSDTIFADRFWSQYTALLEAHKRCSQAIGAIDYPDVDVTEFDKAITEFAKLSSKLYYDILQMIYD